MVYVRDYIWFDNRNEIMKKKLKKVGSDGLMIYFTKEEQEILKLKEGDIVDLDMVVKKEKGKNAN